MAKKYIISNYIKDNDKCMETIKGEHCKNGIIVSFERCFYTDNNNLNKKDLLYKKSIQRYCISAKILKSKGLNSIKDIISYTKKFKISLPKFLKQLSAHSTDIELLLPYKDVVLKRTSVYSSENPIRVIIEDKNYSKYFLDLVVFKGRKIETAESCIFGTLSEQDKLEITNDAVISLYEKLGFLEKEKAHLTSAEENEALIK